MKNVAIMDALPHHNWDKKILEVGCGDGNLSLCLRSLGCNIYATDIKKYDTWDRWKDNEYLTLTFHISDIFDLSSFPVKSASVVIASQVLEHLSNWKLALVHLIALAGVRLIITVPYCRSFFSPGHINFWDDAIPRATPGQLPDRLFKDIQEFTKLCKPFSTSITKIRTKPKDVKMGQYAYLIVVDKRQGLNS